MTNNKIIKLDLACGRNKKSLDYIGVDVINDDNVDIVHDLNVYPWPFEDNSVDEIYCSHYIEHIPHNIGNLKDKRDGLIQFMDEVYRILKPNGKINLIAPYYKSQRAFGDPTHCRYVGDLSFPYYNKEWRDINKLDKYSIRCDFDITYSYYIDNEYTLKSEEVRNKAFREDWDAISDIMIEMIKR